MKNDIKVPSGFYIGASYYPEHWPEDRWEKDIQLMKDLNFNIVRMAEFAWSRLEHKEGEYSFDWLDKVFRILEENKIKVMLCTPTAAPPRWASHKYPEILPVNENGIRKAAGGRKHFCHSSRIYRELSKKLIARMCQHLNSYQELIAAWQIDNEFGAHQSSFCYCKECNNNFREWLREKYEDLNTLNQKWGNVFWSQEFTKWEEVEIPRPAMDGEAPSNKAAVMDYWSFSSDMIVSFVKEQVGVIKKYFPETPVTTNWSGIGRPNFDPADMVKDLDFTSWDNYCEEYHEAAFSHDFVRGMQGGEEPIWVPEHRCAPPDNGMFRPLLPDGLVSSLTMQNIAHGGDGTIYFRWRHCPFGAENAHGGIIDYKGDKTRVFEELQQAAPDFQQIAENVAGSKVKAKVAIVFDMKSLEAINPILPHRLKKRTQYFNYLDNLKSYYNTIVDLNVDVDVIPADADLDKYKFVILPGLYMIPDGFKNKINNFVKAGGYIIGTHKTGIADQNTNLIEKAVPADLTEIFGIEVKEFDCFDINDKIKLVDKNNDNDYYGRICCDLLEVGSADTLYSYGEKFYKGTAAVTLNKWGRGSAIYIGSIIDKDLQEKIVKDCLKELEISCYGLPTGVQMRRRYQGDTEYVFIINHTDEEKKFSLNDNYQDILNGGKFIKEVILKGYGYLVLRS